MNDQLPKLFKYVIYSLITIISIYIIILSSNLLLNIEIQATSHRLLSMLFSEVTNTICLNGSTALDYSNRLELSSNDNSMSRFFTDSSPFFQTVQANLDPSKQIVMITDPILDSDYFQYKESSPSPTATPSKTPTETSPKTEPVNSEPESFTENDPIVGLLPGDVYFEDNDEYDIESVFAQHQFTSSAKEALEYNRSLLKKLKKTNSLPFLLENFYHINDVTGIDKKVFQVKELLQKDLTIKKDNSKPQILIIHTHAHESFLDSKEGNIEDSIVGVGNELVNLLQDKYGYNVLHHTKQYKHKVAYTSALPDLETILKENPSIKVIIDLHRNAANGDTKTSITIDDKKMAKLMFFNGVSQNKNGPITYLKNKNLQTNLAFSLQMKVLAMQEFPELTYKNFLKSYRYNMHLRGRYALVEVGDNNSTVKEAKNAMVPLAYLINETLTKKE